LEPKLKISLFEPKPFENIGTGVFSKLFFDFHIGTKPESVSIFVGIEFFGFFD